MPSISLNWILLLPFLAGMAVTTQTAINGQLRTAVHSPLLTAFISFSIGTLVLGTLVLLTRQEIPTLKQFSEIEVYKLSGGLLGAFFITVVILSVQRLSVANIFSLVVAGQFILALIYDHFGLLGVRQSPITLTRLAGVASLILGAYLINRK
ncbi:DMT family transporter [Pontibacter sp. E15-1]|uniref:DMT family transporter n=1 Tax=Pontibacter sp. E15-1 TaxID=2919918 RepID=UPI001F4F819F|nr:DMT family transporter [Pontibacter sp. E15-1]MCJ8166752.1 DMT family transporter [Pontibacter sp. E15-1]